MGDKTGQPLLAMATEKPGAIDRVKSKLVQRWGIADVMQERRCYERVTIFDREHGGYATRLAGNCLDMRPPGYPRAQAFS